MDFAQGDAVAIIDADLQDPPEVIPDLLAKWREGNDVVYAVRNSREGETFMKKFLAARFYRMFHQMANIDVPMDAGDFRLVDRKVIEALREVRELHRFMRGLTWVGFQQCAVKYDRAARHAGVTKYPVWKSLNLAWDAITSFSGKPLRWMMGVGFLVCAYAVLLALRLIVHKMLGLDETVRGWTSQMTVMLLLWRQPTSLHGPARAVREPGLRGIQEAAALLRARARGLSAVIWRGRATSASPHKEVHRGADRRRRSVPRLVGHCGVRHFSPSRVRSLTVFRRIGSSLRSTSRARAKGSRLRYQSLSRRVSLAVR